MDFKKVKCAGYCWSGKKCPLEKIGIDFECLSVKNNKKHGRIKNNKKLKTTFKYNQPF
jgi:hypothetical protein